MPKRKSAAIKKRHRKNVSRPSASPVPQLYEAEILPGLKEIIQTELRHKLGKSIRYLPTDRADQIAFLYSGSGKTLGQLRTVVAVYQVEQFKVPRPRALLGHQNLQRLLSAVQAIQALHPKHTFQTFTFKAAGRDSAIFQRLQTEFSQHLNLRYDAPEADLVLRVRPALLSQTGWEVLIRLTPRPLSTRSWRVVDMPGALNATTAAAIVNLTNPAPQDHFLNLMAGSGTLLIERLQRCPAKLALGGDISAQALQIASKNLHAAHLQHRGPLIQLKAEQTPFPSHLFNVICSDLPWGQLVGSRNHNQTLYPQILQECARLARPQATLILLTHQIQLLDTLADHYAHLWALQKTLQVYQGGLHPQIYIFKRMHPSK